jgi:RNA polymerase sigma-70 factor (ECF subfamily)
MLCPGGRASVDLKTARRFGYARRPALLRGRPSDSALAGSQLVEFADQEEAQFIERLRSRDERAFNQFVELYEQRIFGLVYRMLGQRDEAEDLTQEVFVQVFKSVGEFRGEARLSTWVYRIAVNLCKNRAKYLSRRRAEAQQPFEASVEGTAWSQAKGVTLGEGSTPDHMLEAYQLQRIVQRCISQLDPDFREVLVLRDVEDLSYGEIGAITSLPDGTVKSRIHRARALLKAAVERELGEKLQ